MMTDITGYSQVFASAKLASEETGVSRSNICLCASGNAETAGGLVWSYV
jgi:hypothetical protein